MSKEPASRSRPIGYVASRASLVLLGLLLGVVSVEGLFRAGAAVAALDLDLLEDPASREIILCVGDSHTWGKGRGYPRRLATLFAERSPKYLVVNLGVPGVNTAEIRKRWVGYLNHYEPAIIVVWAGINNAWNRAHSDLWTEADAEPLSLADLVVEWSRVARFLRVWSFQDELRASLEEGDVYVSPDDRWDRRQRARTRTFLGREDVYRPIHSDAALPKDEISRVTELDLTWLIEKAASRGVPVVPITYALPGAHFLAANRGIRAAADKTGAPLVESRLGEERLRASFTGREEEIPDLYTKSVHPSQVNYEAIAEVAFEVVEREHLLDGKPGFEG